MEKNIVIFKIYINNEMEKEYLFDTSNKIIDIRNKVLNDIFNNSHNYLEMENITERIYKDYGKLFFDIGILPTSIDNYILSQFTNDNRTFSFRVTPINLNIMKPKKDGSFLKKIIKENKEKNGEFIFDDDDFPTL
jgi:hypothetical protein